MCSSARAAVAAKVHLKQRDKAQELTCCEGKKEGKRYDEILRLI